MGVFALFSNYIYTYIGSVGIRFIKMGICVCFFGSQLFIQAAPFGDMCTCDNDHFVSIYFTAPFVDFVFQKTKNIITLEKQLFFKINRKTRSF